MARRLYRFMTMLALPALAFGLWLWLGYGIGKGPGNGWLHAKLALVLVLIGYHHACGSLLKKFETGRNTRSHNWYRWFNEVPVLVLLAIVILVVVKPFCEVTKKVPPCHTPISAPARAAWKPPWPKSWAKSDKPVPP